MKCALAKHGQNSMANKARSAKEHKIRTRGWFSISDRPGDRTFSQQVEGLDPMFGEVHGKAVLDVGCAEGLIALHCATVGARRVDGIEIVPGHIEIALRLREEYERYECSFFVADANEYSPARKYDIVLMLAVLHKLREPAKACERIAMQCTDLCVIRLGPDALERIVDERSNKVTQQIGEVMRGIGFEMERMTRGPFDEATFYYRRRNGTAWRDVGSWAA